MSREWGDRLRRWLLLLAVVCGTFRVLLALLEAEEEFPESRCCSVEGGWGIAGS